MRTTRWIGGGVAAAVATAGLVVGLGGTAFADGGPAPTATAATAVPSGKNDAVCTTRIPAALARIDRITARINGDATTKGSTAWLRQRADQARGNGHTALADLLAQRATDQPQRLQELATLKAQLQDVLQKDCGA